jgi:hypothetical protein
VVWAKEETASKARQAQDFWGDTEFRAKGQETWGKPVLARPRGQGVAKEGQDGPRWAKRTAGVVEVSVVTAGDRDGIGKVVCLRS